MSILNRKTKKADVAAPVAEKKAAAKAKPVVALGGMADRVLLRPLVTEKAAVLNQQRKYVFVVNTDMNKIEVKKAVKAIYGVQPEAVAIVRMKGKYVRFGRTFGQRKDWKKAIVTLKEGDAIEAYEGV